MSTAISTSTPFLASATRLVVSERARKHLHLVRRRRHPGEDAALHLRVLHRVPARDMDPGVDADLLQAPGPAPHDLAAQRVRQEVASATAVRLPAERMPSGAIHVLVVDEDDGAVPTTRGRFAPQTRYTGPTFAAAPPLTGTGRFSFGRAPNHRPIIRPTPDGKANTRSPARQAGPRHVPISRARDLRRERLPRDPRTRRPASPAPRIGLSRPEHRAARRTANAEP